MDQKSEESKVAMEAMEVDGATHEIDDKKTSQINFNGDNIFFLF